MKPIFKFNQANYLDSLESRKTGTFYDTGGKCSYLCNIWVNWKIKGEERFDYEYVAGRYLSAMTNSHVEISLPLKKPYINHPCPSTKDLSCISLKRTITQDKLEFFYYVMFSFIDSKMGANGHSVVIQVNPPTGKIRAFDPNKGEFECSNYEDLFFSFLGNVIRSKRYSACIITKYIDFNENLLLPETNYNSSLSPKPKQPLSQTTRVTTAYPKTTPLLSSIIEKPLSPPPHIAVNPMAKVRKQWINDSESKTCMACGNRLWMGNRHHCRSCGILICNKCTCTTRKALNLYDLSFTNNSQRTKAISSSPKKVCKTCYEQLEGHARQHPHRPQPYLYLRREHNRKSNNNSTNKRPNRYLTKDNY
ncbi:MAG: hypothetical protein GY710_07125 [Desulfobacteraceae bacterium]|nr:hypothetical protein [Desulfobacteraceae bacterium]